MSLKALFNTLPLARLARTSTPVPLARVDVPPFPRAIPVNALEGADGSFFMGADGTILEGAGT